MSRINKILSISMLIAFIVAGAFLLKGRVNELKNILNIDIKYLIPMLFLISMRPFLKGLRLKMIAKRYNLHLKFKEWLGLTILTTFGNYISPFRAGGAATAVYLKKRYHFPYTFYASLTGTLYLTQFLTFGISGLVLTLIQKLPQNIEYGLIIFFLGILSVSIFLLFFLPLPIRTDKKILNHLANAITEFRRVRSKTFVIQAFIIDSLRIIVEASSFYLAFRAFGFQANIFAIMLMSILSGLSLIISITPMGLGVRETLIIITSKIIGADIMTGAFVAALDRAIAIIAVCLSAPIFSYLIFKRKEQTV